MRVTRPSVRVAFVQLLRLFGNFVRVGVMRAMPPASSPRQKYPQNLTQSLRRRRLLPCAKSSKARAYSIGLSATASVEVGYMRPAPRDGCLNRNPVLGDYVRSERAMTRSLLKSPKGGPL